MNKLVPMTIVVSMMTAFVSCAGPSREEIKKIKMIEKKDLAKCQAIESVRGVNDKGSEALAIEEVKRAAFNLGADSIYIQDSVNNGSAYAVVAMAYRCK